MTHPDIIEALASAHRNDMLRATARPRGVVVRRGGWRRRERVAAWLRAQLRAQLHRALRPATGSHECAAVTR
jgi:hypothetical protein